MKFSANNHQLSMALVVVVALLAPSFVTSTKKLDDDNDFSTNDHTILSEIENKLQQQQSVPSIEKLLKQLQKRSLNTSSESEPVPEPDKEENSAGQKLSKKWIPNNIGKYFGKGKKQSGNNTKNEQKVKSPSKKDWKKLKKFESNLIEMKSFFKQFQIDDTRLSRISLDDLVNGLQAFSDMFWELLGFAKKMADANKVATFRPIYVIGTEMKQLKNYIKENVPNAKIWGQNFTICCYTLFDEFISNLPQNETFDTSDEPPRVFNKKNFMFLISSLFAAGGAGIYAAHAFGLFSTTEHPSQIRESIVANGLQWISNGTPTLDSFTLTNILVICIIVLLLVGLIATALVLIFRCFGKRSMDQLDKNQPPLPAKSGVKSKRRKNDNNNIDMTKRKLKTKTISSIKKKQRNKKQTKSEKTEKNPNDSSSTTPTFVPTTPENSAKQETFLATENSAEIHKSGQLPPPQPPPPRKKSSQRREVSKSQTPNPDKKKSIPRNLISPGPFKGGEGGGATASSSKKKESGSPKQKVLLPASKIPNQTKERTLETINKSKLSQLDSSDLEIPSFGSYQMKTDFNSSDDGSVVDTVTSSV